MATAGYSHLFAAILTASINAAYSEVASAATLNPDGIYAVDITTRQGECDKAYHWTISVSGGHVNSVGATPMAASGQISGSGTVELAFRRFGHVATVTGRFASGSGHLVLVDYALRRFVASGTARLSPGKFPARAQ